MRRDAFAAFASLAIVALGLLACAVAPQPQVQAKLSRSALYEQQVEEGFGRLDLLPSNYAMLPR